MISQVIGSTLAALTLRLLFGLDQDVCSGKHDVFVGTVPSGTNLQSFVIEFIITFYLMFIISGVATDNRAVSIFKVVLFTLHGGYIVKFDGYILGILTVLSMSFNIFGFERSSHGNNALFKVAFRENGFATL